MVGEGGREKGRREEGKKGGRRNLHIMRSLSSVKYHESY
jgi:hypothetical protein